MTHAVLGFRLFVELRNVNRWFEMCTKSLLRVTKWLAELHGTGFKQWRHLLKSVNKSQRSLSSCANKTMAKQVEPRRVKSEGTLEGKHLAIQIGPRRRIS